MLACCDGGLLSGIAYFLLSVISNDAEVTS
jgi:hypothetical protein